MNSIMPVMKTRVNPNFRGQYSQNNSQAIIQRNSNFYPGIPEGQLRVNKELNPEMIETIREKYGQAILERVGRLVRGGANEDNIRCILSHL